MLDQFVSQAALTDHDHNHVHTIGHQEEEVDGEQTDYNQSLYGYNDRGEKIEGDD